MASSNILTHSKVLANHDASAATTDFYNGGLNTGVNSFDPYVSGYAFAVWVSVPSWVERIEPEFRQLFMKNFKSFSGINNLELETEGVKGGFSNNETHYTKSIGNKPTDFSVKYQAHVGCRLSGAYDAWVSGIRDPHTGIATYAKEFGIEYHSSNHTGTLLYVVTKPDADNWGANNIEKAFLWTHVQPKRINLERYNFEAGNHDFFEEEQSFSGVMHFGQTVDEFAAGYIADKVYTFYSENSFQNIAKYTG